MIKTASQMARDYRRQLSTDDEVYDGPARLMHLGWKMSNKYPAHYANGLKKLLLAAHENGGVVPGNLPGFPFGLTIYVGRLSIEGLVRKVKYQHRLTRAGKALVKEILR